MIQHITSLFRLGMASALIALAAAAAADGATSPDVSIDETVTFFYYEDIEAAAPFYEDLLQLTKTMDEDWVKIYRITANTSVGLVLQGRGLHDVSADKPAMLSMVTGDVDAWYARLTAAAVPVRKALPAADHDRASGGAPIRGFVVEDPGGYTIEFFQWQSDPE